MIQSEGLRDRKILTKWRPGRGSGDPTLSTQTTYAYITRTPGICGGRPRIEGHRVRVQDIAVEHERQALSAEEICQQHPGLTLAKVYSALAYFHDHRDEILADLETDRRAVEAFRKAHPNSVR
jgi:uncharacterized protein (DUF433 family)